MGHPVLRTKTRTVDKTELKSKRKEPIKPADIRIGNIDVAATVVRGPSRRGDTAGDGGGGADGRGQP